MAAATDGRYWHGMIMVKGQACARPSILVHFGRG